MKATNPVKAVTIPVKTINLEKIANPITATHPEIKTENRIQETINIDDFFEDNSLPSAAGVAAKKSEKGKTTSVDLSSFDLDDET